MKKNEKLLWIIGIIIWLVSILISISSAAQKVGTWFVEPSISATGRLNAMPAVDIGKRIGYCEFAAVVSFETGVVVPTYSARTAYVFPLSDYSYDELVLQLGLGWTQNCGSKLEGSNQWTGLLGLQYLDGQSGVSFILRYIGGTIVVGFAYKIN